MTVSRTVLGLVSVQTPEHGAMQVYNALETIVSAPSFLLKLASFRKARKGAPGELQGSEVSQPSFWEAPEGGSCEQDEPGYQEASSIYTWPIT